jgi:hypothetical protein
MVFGALCYTSVSLSVLFFSNQELEAMGWGLAYLYVLQGIGRLVFESTNKAVFADFFPKDEVSAFANLTAWSGL